MNLHDTISIEAVLTGTAQPLGPKDEPSAIGKRPVDGPVTVGQLGLHGDEQADLRVHGGLDKAIHHYPRDHYAGWIASLGARPPLDASGAFGENISTSGWTEVDVCIGDRFRLGTALVEIAQGRQPCWKQAAFLGDPQVVATMVATGRTGWYYRVIEQGVVRVGDGLSLQERLFPEWTVARLFGLVIGGAHRGETAALSELAGMSVLADGWRARAASLRC